LSPAFYAFDEFALPVQRLVMSTLDLAGLCGDLTASADIDVECSSAAPPKGLQNDSLPTRRFVSVRN
jgi:hypothetical protein